MENGPAKPKKPRTVARLIEGKCIACGARCQLACPADCIEMNAQGEPVIQVEECIGCRKCVKICPAEALEMVAREPAATAAEEPVSDSNPVDSAAEQPDEVRLAADEKAAEVCQGLWVFVEQCQGEAHPVSWELLGAGQKLASELGVELCAFILGAQVAHLSQQAFGYGADKVYLVDSPVLGRYRTEPYLDATVRLIRKYRPEIVLMGATGLGRDLAGAVATRLETGLTADCTGLSIDKHRRLLEQTRPAFGGNIMATILTETARPQMASVRPYVMPCPTLQSGRAGQLIVEPWTCSEDEIRTKILDVIPFTSEGSVDIAGANVIVSGGRGMLAPENFGLLEELAHTLGGVVGASRGAVAAGWAPHGRQVGQTGKTVKPRLYIACGISGAIQHLVGMQDSDRIIAINKDANAPIFEVAQLGIVGDVLEIVPALTAELRQRKAEIVPH
jgi:electron transfer flavoprotein alpha subunit